MTETYQDNSPIQSPPDSSDTSKPEDVVTYISTGKFQDSDNYKSLISSNKTELAYLKGIYNLLQGREIDPDSKNAIEAAGGKTVDLGKKGIAKFIEDIKGFWKKIKDYKHKKVIAIVGVGIAGLIIVILLL
ncbi:MAG: hypothetical protein WC393_04295 [Candidatus Nanoarchaeia archaeon]|jgi:hypothetical protein